MNCLQGDSASHVVEAWPKHAWIFAGCSEEHLEVPTFPGMPVLIV